MQIHWNTPPPPIHTIARMNESRYPARKQESHAFNQKTAAYIPFFENIFYLQVTISRIKVQATLIVDGVTATAQGNPGPSFINDIDYLYFGGYFTEVTAAKINVRFFTIIFLLGIV